MNETQPKAIDKDLLKTMPLPAYSEADDKADYGKLLVIAGSMRLPGAAILVARAALRSGCGSVRVAVPASIAIAIGVAVPELLVLSLPDTKAAALPLLREQFEDCDAVVIGPGLDDGEETAKVIAEIASDCRLPVVLDAQALTAAPKGSSNGPRLFTPHLAEMAALTGLSVEEIESDRQGYATKFAAQHKATLLLKGRETLIAAPDGTVYKNTAGSRGLGIAGSGDVLAGIIGSLLAQKLDAITAAVWGAHLHGLAGEAESKDSGDDGLLASDLIHRLPSVIRYLRRSVEARKETERSGLRR